MDLHRHAGLVDQLAAEYTLGVLRGGSRRRFESISQRDPAIRLAVESWRLRLTAMSELGPAVAPPPDVWPAIERRLNLVNARRDAAAGPVPSAAPVTRSKPSWFENLSFWRGWSIAATAIAAIALVVSIRELSTVAPVPAPVPAPQVAQEPRIGYVATLADDKSNARMLVTWDDLTSEVTVRRLSGSSDPSDKSMQLWGLPKEGHPVSLGVLPVGGTARFKAAFVNTYPVLAVSVEPVGGSPNPNGPTGPVVYTGKVIPAA
ncbi:anti-sigma factor [Caballeronia sp. SEWSISQ10-4 2]|uniref:anti-sigma factor n=1 Tax=Caballeronia sp. SEWSISQ10-4 2 TaxID=2937438 RepID=UPI00264E9340|nr:anti-sigma factor [Caballeronia sp. SEWSISQ10-4 2]MDN7176920.1 anti-sigma factor [Caballeronia sp. SEWSISQ10-4 2]